MARILIVDGDESYRRVCARFLEDDGHEVLTAETGFEALRLAAEEPVDAVVTEVRLAGMDGLDLMNRLLARRRDVVVILNSTSCAYKDSFMSWSADACWTKSDDGRELSKAVRDLLDARRLQARPHDADMPVSGETRDPVGVWV